jgi:tetratricopeptide (TPR) repeat protein
MAGMRDDEDQLARTRKMLEGVASIDVAGAIVEEQVGGGIGGAAGRFYLPADGAPVVAGTRVSLDVVVRNLLVGHRFPGGVMDVQDTWIELDVKDARGARIASSGLDHETDVDDEDTHVLRAYVVNDQGEILEEHELPSFRGAVANHTIAARDAIAVRYAFDVPEALAAEQLPLVVEARLRHRSRTLRFQKEVCREARTPGGKRFLDGTRAARDAELDPCKPQPITEIAAVRVELGAGAVPTAARPAWQRLYEHGMALIPVVTERLDEPRLILEAALAAVPADDAKGRAAVLVQLGSVAGRQGRTDDAIALLEQARGLLTAPYPPAIDFIAADALARVWRWDEAATYAQAATERAPLNTLAWVMLARARGSLHDDAGALEAARRGLAISPRDPDLLRSQATALRGLDPDLADDALAAFDRFRAPDAAPQLRMTCAGSSQRCAREREMGHTHAMKQSR